MSTFSFPYTIRAASSPKSGQLSIQGPSGVRETAFSGGPNADWISHDPLAYAIVNEYCETGVTSGVAVVTATSS